MCFCSQQSGRSPLHRVHVYGNAVHSLRRGRDHEPALFILYERQEIVLIFDSKLQFVLPISFRAMQTESLANRSASRGICISLRTANSSELKPLGTIN